MSEKWEIELYRDLVKAKLLTHLGQGNKPAELPEGIRLGSQKLSENQQKKLEEKLENLYQHILNADEAELWNVPNFYGDRTEVKKLLLRVVSWATSESKEKADEAKTKIDSAREINDATGDAAPGTGDEDTKMKSDAGSASDHGEGQDRPESRDTPSDSEEPETSLKSKAHPNLHVTSTSGGLKTEHKNGSIIEHLLKADRPVLEIKDDEKETHVLAEIQSIRPQRRGAPNQGVEYISQFVVERRYPDTKAWCVEAVDQREVSSAVKDWNAIEKNKWIHRPSEEANKSFSKEDLGEMVLHLACFYNVPKLRTAGAARRNPPTRHILITSNQGLMMMSDGNFKRYIGNDEEANKYTAESCKRAKIPAPWETESKEIKGMVDTCHRPLSKTVKAGGIVQMPQHITESSSLFGTKELEARIARVEDRIDKIDKLEMQVNQMMKLLQKALDL